MADEMLKAQVKAYVETNWEDIVKDIEDLVAIRSVENMAEATEQMPYGPEPYQALCKGVEIADRLGLDAHNCDGHIGYADLAGESDKQIAIIAHSDIVPEGSGWTFDPFKLTRKDGYLIGRGVLDDKGPLVLELYCAKYFAEQVAKNGCVDDRTRMEFNAIKTMWSAYDHLTVNVKVPAAYQMMFGGLSEYAMTEYKHWRNGWRYQFGIEHKLNAKWTIRAGFVYDTESAHDPQYNDFMVPTGTRRTYTVGASYRNKNVEYSIGYGYMYVSDKWIYNAGEKGENARSRGCDAHIISLGARIDL